MSYAFKILFRGILVLSLFLFMTHCTPDNGGSSGEEDGNDSDTYDIDLKGIPKFVNASYIELFKIKNISRFRSGIGHDYSDDFETCRSMKHYFQPKGTVAWSSVNIFSPVTGKVSNIREEWAGTQVSVQSDQYPAFFFILFHVNLSGPLDVGDPVVAGQFLGTHVGSQTWSDIAVGVNTPGGWKLVSYFDVMTDLLFQNLQSRGVGQRDALIISKQQRDSDPLVCEGDTFLTSGNLENWVTLN